MKIIAIGRNYREHAEELNNPIPAEPLFFLMPETALLPKNHPLYLPDFSDNIQYEVELVVKINRLGKNIEEKFANRYYNEIGIGIDFTARDVQEDLISKGLPWEKAKSFDGASPVSRFIPKDKFSDVNNINFSLKKNGEDVQTGNSNNMIFPIDAIISHVSKYFTLKIGDLIFTGTPAGVGKVNIGDKLSAFINNQELLSIDIK